MNVAIHTNPNLKNQTDYGKWLKEGFAVHGIDALVTPNIDLGADVHVIQGPWYAYDEWVGKPNVLWLNRCFYGDHFHDVSLGWLNADGTRDFGDIDKPEPNGELPRLQAKKARRKSSKAWGGTCVVFGDFGRDPKEDCAFARKHFDRVYYRPHPAERKTDSPVMSPDWTLAEAFSIADSALGHSSTVLVKARINGLKTFSTDTRHVVLWEPDDDAKWLRMLSWCQWNSEQIRSGEFWEHLNEGFDRTSQRSHAA